MHSSLLTGDADAAIEEKILFEVNVKNTYLKAGHHGSNTSSSVAFSKAVRPADTILSHNNDNSYGHPHPKVLQRLNAVGSKNLFDSSVRRYDYYYKGTTHSVSAKPWTGAVAPKPIENKPQPKPEPKPNPKSYFLSYLYTIPCVHTSFQSTKIQVYSRAFFFTDFLYNSSSNYDENEKTSTTGLEKTLNLESRLWHSIF